MGEWNARYLGSRPRATDTRTFAFERPDDLEYAPGQFFFVLLDDEGTSDPKAIEHHFSFSSSPTEPNVEFTTRLTGHEFKNRMLALEPGQLVHIAGPDGAFVLGPEMRKVAYLAAGIGITPARSNVRWAVDSHAPVDIVVLYGNRDSASTAFREEFEALPEGRVRVVSVLSDPEPGWPGRSGFIDAEVVREEIPDWPERDFFVSGPPTVVGSLVDMLTQQVGVSAERIVSEHFPGYAG